jgi:hypothetical protein
VSALAYLRVSAWRTRATLVPAAGCLFAVIGTFAGTRNEVGGAWALTALFGCALGAWLTGAILAGEPAAQADMATVAMGGRAGRLRADVVLVATVALALTALFIIYPLALGTVREHVFDRRPGAADIVAAIGVHLVCAAFGGAVGVLFAPPRVIRRATAAAATLAVLIGALAIGDSLGAFGGPVATAQRLSDAHARTIGGGELLAATTCAALTAALLAATARWTRLRA